MAPSADNEVHVDLKTADVRASNLQDGLERAVYARSPTTGEYCCVPDERLANIPWGDCLHCVVLVIFLILRSSIVQLRLPSVLIPLRQSLSSCPGALSIAANRRTHQERPLEDAGG